jgi:curved DNA-binding protein CbpA
MAETGGPHEVLGVTREATTEEVRQAYLKLVREFPPDREPDRFREIHDAYQLLSDPLEQAKAGLRPIKEPPRLEDVIDAAEKQPPRLPKLVLLALGNEA